MAYLRIQILIVLAALHELFVLIVVAEIHRTIKERAVIGIERFHVMTEDKVAILGGEEGVEEPFGNRPFPPSRVHVDPELRARRTQDSERCRRKLGHNWLCVASTCLNE